MSTAYPSSAFWSGVIRASWLVVPFLLASACGSEGTRAMDIPAGPAARTLKEFSRQARVQIVFDSHSVEGVTTNPIHDRLTPADSLERMLRGTPLVARYDKDTGAYAILRGKPLRSSSSQPSQTDLAPRVPTNDLLTKPKGDWRIRNL